VVEVHHGGGFCGGTGQGLEEAAVMAVPEREETGKHLGPTGAVGTGSGPPANGPTPVARSRPAASSRPAAAQPNGVIGLRLPNKNGEQTSFSPFF